MKKPYAEPSVTIDYFDEVIVTDGINGRIPGGASGHETNGFIDEEEEY